MEILSPPLHRPDATADLVRRLGIILAAVMVVVARRFVVAPLVVLNVPLWGWLSRTVQRFGRAAGQPAAVARASRAGREVAPRARGVRLPSRRGWLLQTLGWEVAGSRAQLEALLGEAEMQALVAARPRLGRLLRPICRMLAIEVPGLALPVVVKPEVAVRRKAKRAAVIWPRKGLPEVAKGGWFEVPRKNWGMAG